MPKYPSRYLGKLLVEHGLAPENCTNAELHVRAEGVVFVRFDVMVEGDQWRKLARVFAAVADDAERGQIVKAHNVMEVTDFGPEGNTTRTVAVGGTAEELNTRRGQ